MEKLYELDFHTIKTLFDAGKTLNGNAHGTKFDFNDHVKKFKKSKFGGMYDKESYTSEFEKKNFNNFNFGGMMTKPFMEYDESG